MPPTNGMIPLCKNSSQLEESVRPFRCLHANSKRENVVSPAMDCNITRIDGSDDCRSGDKWQQTASVECTKQGMVLDSSIMTLDWCGLDDFRGVEFICCPLRGRKVRFVLLCSLTVPLDIDEKAGNDADYQISFDEQDDDTDEALTEDDPIRELVVVPKVKSVDTHRKLLAKSRSPSGKTNTKDPARSFPSSSVLAEPKWLEDSRQWNTDSGYFAGKSRGRCLTRHIPLFLSDDEDTDDEQNDLNPSSRKRKSQVTINEHDRFTKDKEDFRRKYNEQIEQVGRTSLYAPPFLTLTRPVKISPSTTARRNPADCQSRSHSSPEPVRNQRGQLPSRVRRSQANSRPRTSAHQRTAREESRSST